MGGNGSGGRRLGAGRKRKHPTNAAKDRRGKLKRYGLTLGEYDGLLIAQRGKCAICAAEVPLCIDHCHESGQVRGLLCRECNLAIGLFADDAARLRAAAEYLEQRSDVINVGLA